MPVTRRAVLRGALGVAGASVAAGLAGSGRAYALPKPSGAGTTLEQTIVRGAAGAGGYAPLTVAAGEPFLFRGELAAQASHTADGRKVLACFAHLTDMHVTDVQSPARFEFLDAYGSVPQLSDFTSAYRPHELLGTQVGDAMVRQLRKVGRGPATGAPLRFAVVTG